MLIIISIITLFCGYKIVISKGDVRIDWFLGSSLLIYSSWVLLEKPHVISSFFFILCYTTSLIRHHEFSLKGIPLRSLWIIYLLGFLVIGANAEGLSAFSKVWKPFSLFISTYFILILGYLSSDSFNGFDRNLSRIILVMCFYGFLTFILREDILRQILTPDYSRNYYFGDRLRIASTCFHPIAYGFICCMLFLQVFICKKTPWRMVLLISLAISVLLCGSRTALVAFFCIMAVYILLGLKLNEKIRIVASSAILCVLAALFISPVNQKISDVINSIEGKEDTSGSSMEMRQGQLDASLAIASQFPITGGGFDYIQEGLGYGKDIDSSYWIEYGDLYGFESYLYVLIIERGALGIFLEFVVFLTMFIWLFKKRKVSKEYSATAIAILMSFLLFSLMTGTLNTWLISMFFIGIYIGKLRKIELSKGISHNSI